MDPAISSTSFPLNVNLPSNEYWTIYGRQGPLIYAQPKFISYPLFVPVHIQGDLLVYIGIAGIPDELINDSTLAKSKFYNRVLKILTNMSQDYSYPFEKGYKSLPFNGSHVAIRRSLELAGVESDMRWGYGFEAQTRSYAVLRSLWGFGGGNGSLMSVHATAELPPVLPLESLQLRMWLHDTVAVVSVSKDPRKLYAFKTNRSPEILYQEIHTLLNIPPHPNIIGCPSYLITKQTNYSMFHPFDPASVYLSEPTQPIIGFLAPYHSGGTLGNYIKCHTLTAANQAKWACQLTSALLHVFNDGGGSRSKRGKYTALKMDNIILDSSKNLRLIDFEHAGTWVQYTPIEVLNAGPVTGKMLTHFARLGGAKYTLGSAPGPGEICSVCEPHPCCVPRDATRSECYNLHLEVFSFSLSHANILSPLKPNSDALYKGPAYPRKIPFWMDATDEECEAAMVWMLCCCLWCIFEGRPCLSEIGGEWFPIKYPLWHKAKNSVPENVLTIVAKSLEPYAPRPTLKELLEVLEVWRALQEQEAVDISGTPSLSGDSEKLEAIIDTDIDAKKRPLRKTTVNIPGKKRKTGATKNARS